MTRHEEAVMLHILNGTLMSVTHQQAYANAFSWWCRMREEYNPRRITLVVWLEANYPEIDTQWSKALYANIDEIWDKVFNGVKVKYEI